MHVVPRPLRAAALALVPAWPIWPALLGRGAAPLPTVPNVDLERYAGTWYEIASIPGFPHRTCYSSTTTFRLVLPDELEVIHRCHLGAPDGAVKETRGRVWARDLKTPGRMRVQFSWALRADYFIIDQGQDYDYSVIGHPSRRLLWILSRTPTMSPERCAELLARISDKGFDPARVVRAARDPSIPSLRTRAEALADAVSS